MTVAETDVRAPEKTGLLESLLSTVERLGDTVRLQQQIIEGLMKRVDELEERAGERCD